MRAVLRWTAIGAGLLLVLGAGLCLASYRRFSANITTDSAAEQVLAEYAAQRPAALVPQARNILVMGAQDASPAIGGTGRDAAVLLHLSADRTRAAAVAVPRDLRLGVPTCRLPGGGTVPAAYEPFAAAFRSGGAACSIRAFERLSGVRVDHHLVVDVPRFGRIADAVGGARGESRGADRELLGDPRRDLLRALAGAARGGGSLAHPARLFGLLDTATSAVTADPGLSSLPALYELAGALRRLPAGGVTLVTLPVAPDAGTAGGDAAVHGGAPGNVLRQPAADRLFAALRADRPPAPDADPWDGPRHPGARVARR
ncbi:LCP family protein [Actinacidiphila paucisporea]|uniref:Transcriptional attenuator, LytR family n=1 Tax=Actinacidiphila paucisporea TaxID=310782 RepID=A0A1M7N383_9ACTN|nr:LCP family protein [Actinacidiphila paucisporea]SHM98020.1 transcriptional attenuator, LytR family [Actinacidiphila paucisporea]